MFDFRHWDMLQANLFRMILILFWLPLFQEVFCELLLKYGQCCKKKIFFQTCFCFECFSNSVSNRESQCIRCHYKMIILQDMYFIETKLFRIIFFGILEALLSLFSDYVSQLKQLKCGYLICTAVLCLNLLLLQVQRDAYKMVSAAILLYSYFKANTVKGVSAQHVVQWVTGNNIFSFWQIMFKNCNLINYSFSKSR